MWTATLFARARFARSFLAACIAALLAATAHADPRVILISLDGATPQLVKQYLEDGTLPRHRGLGLLARHGLTAERNITANPSLTAPGHITMATGSTAARNDIMANTFHLVASPFASTISGFGAPIGGYNFHGPAEHDHDHASAEPLWIALRAAGKRVVTATFPGGDGVDVRVPGLGPAAPIIQSAAKRTVDYTVPFGAFGGVGAVGFVRTAADFSAAPATTVEQLSAAGKASFSPVRQTTLPVETFTVGGVTYRILAAALDTSNDGQVNYDTLVFFDQTLGIQPGPFSLPSTGPAYVKAADKRSGKFYLEGSSTRAGTAFYVSLLAPDLATVRFARYSANFIPRNTPVLADVDDINENVGFWAPQPDFRIPERLSPGFGPFPDLELEDMYQDLVRTFVDYQTRVALHAIKRNPNADLVMAYIEQPDGSGHQFLLTDPRQPTDFLNRDSIGAGQDPAKIARYRKYLAFAYQVASEAVHRIIEAVGTDRRGRPRSDIFVVSDHGFAPFHTAVNMASFLAAKGFDPNKVRAITSGPAANIYINLQGREPAGPLAGFAVTRAEYLELQKQLVAALREFAELNPHYRHGSRQPIFDQIHTRPVVGGVNDPQFGLRDSPVIGQDSGDIYATLSLGYNFDGTQSPVVTRKGDDPAATPVILSVPNFYGAHGYDPSLRQMSALFYAAGPNICRGELERVRNIDVAPTILRLLHVRPAKTVEGRAIDLCDDHGRRDHDRDDDDDHRRGDWDDDRRDGRG